MARKIILDYSKRTDGGFVTKVSNILSSMTDNPDFPTPIPPLVSISEALGEFVSALSAASEGGTSLTEIKNQKRIVVADLVRQLGLYILYIANNDVEVLAGTGYDLTKIPGSQPLGKPGVVTIKDGISSGMLSTFVTRPEGAKSFLYQITPDPLTAESVWESTPGSKAKYTFTDLIPGKKYWIRYVAVGKEGALAYSDPYLSKFVQ
jgi:hypothetical protein